MTKAKDGSTLDTKEKELIHALGEVARVRLELLVSSALCGEETDTNREMLVDSITDIQDAKQRRG